MPGAWKILPRLDIHSVPQLTSLFAFGSLIPIEMEFWKEEEFDVEVAVVNALAQFVRRKVVFWKTEGVD